MKVLILAFDGQIRGALKAQFSVRNRPFRIEGEEWLAGMVEAQGSAVAVVPKDIGLVVNAFSLEGLQQGGGAELIDSLASLAQACEQQQIPLMQLSSSQVFDGFEEGRHQEEEEVVPGSHEGALLARMEELLRGTCHKHIIVRTGLLFSSVGENPLTELLQAFARGETQRLSNSDRSCPTHAKDLARVISAMVDQLSCGCEAWGTYHYSSSDPVSHYQFAETLLSVASQYSDAGDSADILEAHDPEQETQEEKTAWSRPLLNCDKILNTFGIKQLPWRAFIVPTVKQFYEPEDTAPA